MPETYLGPAQAAKYMNIGITLFYQLRKGDAAFPAAIPLGRCRRYSVYDLDAYMQSKKPKPVTPDPELEKEAADIIRSHRKPQEENHAHA